MITSCVGWAPPSSSSPPSICCGETKLLRRQHQSPSASSLSFSRSFPSLPISTTTITTLSPTNPKGSVIRAAWTRRSRGEAAKRPSRKSWKRRTDMYMRPFLLDIFFSKKFIHAKLTHRGTSKVICAATTNAKDLRNSLPSLIDPDACRIIGKLIAERSKEADVYAMAYEPRKNERIEGENDDVDNKNKKKNKKRGQESVKDEDDDDDGSGTALKGTILAGVLLVGFVGGFASVGYFYREPINSFLNQFSGFIEGYGSAGYALFVAVYAGLEILAIPAVPLTMSAGLLFGSLTGTIIVSISGTVAASVAFLIARYFARERILKLVEGNKKFLAIDKAIGENGFKVVTLLRLSPLLPFSLGNYLYGLTSVKFLPYVLGSWLGMLPGTWAYVSAGAFGRAIIVFSVKASLAGLDYRRSEGHKVDELVWKGGAGDIFCRCVVAVRGVPHSLAHWIYRI
ncbi:hypothetical protein TSUD_269500 [Trifolium subterraneum]|uniref:VTT domain-containing protein n=2 Tax=Trifolium TaxID=3898 RepID=A0A2Z6NPY9_TRISU|nr:hypothetical protein TSUD_269500 [Trifolium subterraneum]